jgi:hypothetical protein
MFSFLRVSVTVSLERQQVDSWTHSSGSSSLVANSWNRVPSPPESDPLESLRKSVGAVSTRVVTAVVDGVRMFFGETCVTVLSDPRCAFSAVGLVC